jgi:hypothetical protein
LPKPVSGSGEPGTVSAGDQGDGELVVVRQAVLATVDHAFGNIFQRLYHLLRTLRSGTNHVVPALEESVREVQSLLELFVDYVAPTPLEMRPLRTTDVASSFRRHADDELGTERIQLVVKDDPTAMVAVDPSRLGRVFHLLAQLLAERASADGLSGVCAPSATGTHFEIRIDGLTPVNSPEAELRWALAEKLVDLQGGELRWLAAGQGAGWTLRLPLMVR